MRVKRILGIVIAAAGIAVAPGVASGQDKAAMQESSGAGKQDSNPSPQKPHKVWTNDDLGSVRSPADAYTQEKETRATQAELAAKQAATDKKPAPGPAPQLGSHPALANPKSVTDADSMMSWENRDIEAQQETVAQLQKELDGAPPERREALQKLLQERMQVLAESRKELQALQAKKQELQQKASASSDAPAAKSPSQ